MADLTVSSSVDELMAAADKAAMRTVLQLTSLATATPGTGVATALAVNVGTDGAVVVQGGALGTPSAGTLTSCTGLPPAGVTGTAAILGANTFSGTQTITQASVNAGILASTGYSLTGSDATSMVNLAGTLNTSGAPDVFKVAITRTATGTATNYFNFLGGAAGTTSLLRLKDNNATVAGSASLILGSATGARELELFPDTTARFQLRTSDGVTTFLQFQTNSGTSGASVFVMNGVLNLGTQTQNDCQIWRDGAAGVLAQRNGVNAQTSRVYGTYTDSSNYVRASLAATSTSVTLAAETAGTGADDVSITITPGGAGQTILNGQVLISEAAITSVLALNDNVNLSLGVGTGTKIGITTSDKLAFWGADPAAQQASVADATGGVVEDAEARASLNSLLAKLRTLGIIAT